MPRIVLIHADPGIRTTLRQTLRTAGHTVLTASSAARALALFSAGTVDLAISDLSLRDSTGLHVLKTIRSWELTTPFIGLGRVGETKEAVRAMQLGATDVVDQSLAGDELLALVERTVSGSRGDVPPRANLRPPAHIEAYAAARLSRALVPLVDCPRDPRTIADWGRWIAASSGAVRNWCATAGVPPRRALVFGRILRAVVLNEAGHHRLENLLDIADLRTLRRLLRLGGFQDKDGFPVSVNDFLERQTLTRDPAVLVEIRRAVTEHEASRVSARSVPDEQVATADDGGTQ